MEITLERRIEKLEAYSEIENTMGLYAAWHACCMHEECLKLHALDTPGVRAEFPFGIFEGREKLTELYTVMVGARDHEPALRLGSLHQTTMTTQVIEVADDLQTAKGVWMCPAHATEGQAANIAESVNVQLAKYACDFVRENGKWKIWHFRIFGVFGTPYHMSWVESGVTPPKGPGDLPPMFSPSRPPHPFWQYWQKGVYPTDQPEPPLPYAHFDDTNAY